MLQHFRRCLHHTCVRFKGSVKKELKTIDILLKYLRTPSGCVHDVIPQANSDSLVNETVMKKMLLLAGLETELSHESIIKWKEALNTQLAFIHHLRDIDTGGSEGKPLEVFRLLEKDHTPQQALGLEEIKLLIENYNLDASSVTHSNQFDGRKFVRSRVEHVQQGPAKE